MASFINKVKRFIKYWLFDRKGFVYLVIEVNAPFTKLPPLDDSILIRMAFEEDKPKIHNDLFPHILDSFENDKRYFDLIGEKNFKCFLAEREDTLIHYFHVYHSASSSPLIKTPKGKKIIRDNDAYMGSTFTVEDFRSLWIAPHSVSIIIDHLRSIGRERALVLVHKDTPGAESFYKRLGFKEAI